MPPQVRLGNMCGLFNRSTHVAQAAGPQLPAIHNTQYTYCGYDLRCLLGKRTARQRLRPRSGRLRSHSGRLRLHSGRLRSHSGRLRSHSGRLRSHSGRLRSHSGRLRSHSGRLRSHHTHKPSASRVSLPTRPAGLWRAVHGRAGERGEPVVLAHNYVQ